MRLGQRRDPFSVDGTTLYKRYPLTPEAVVAVGSRVSGMETVVVHAADAAEPYSGAHELQRNSAPLKSAPFQP